nr:unnamed protein product [Digitaria exilis]
MPARGKSAVKAGALPFPARLRRGAPEHLGQHGGLLRRRHGRLPRPPQDLQLRLPLLPRAQPRAHLHLHREPRHRARERPLRGQRRRVAVLVVAAPSKEEAAAVVAGLLFPGAVGFVRVRVGERAAEVVVGALQAEEALDESLGEQRVDDLLAAVVPNAERELEREGADAGVVVAGRAEQRDEPRELAAGVELVHERASDGVHQPVERAQRRRRAGRGLHQRADGRAHQHRPHEHVLTEPHQRQHRRRAPVAHRRVPELRLYGGEHAVPEQLTLEPWVEPAGGQQPRLELREERSGGGGAAIPSDTGPTQRGHEARDGLAVDPRLDLPGDGAGHALDPPPRRAPAAPRAEGPNHPAPHLLLPGCAARVNGGRELPEPVEEPAQGGEAGVAGEEVCLETTRCRERRLLLRVAGRWRAGCSACIIAGSLSAGNGEPLLSWP